MRFLHDLDRRWLFALVLVCVLAPLLRPVKLSIHPTRTTRSFYDTLERLPRGSRILISADYDPASKPELQPMMLSLLEQAFRRDFKVVVMELWANGVPVAQEALDQKAREFHKVYGVDYVNLGFKEGQQVVMVSLGTQGFQAVYPADFLGTPVGRIPVMREVRDFSSFAAIANISAGYPGTKEWVQQVVSRFHIPLGSGTTAVSAAEYYVYYGSGQIFGLLGGMAGAAEYEQLVGRPGLGTNGMGAMSFAHFLIVAFIVLGNVLGWLRPGRGGKRP